MFEDYPTQEMPAVEAEIPSNVVPLWRVQRIGGIAMPLGTMSYSELMGVYMNAQSHRERAEADVVLVEQYLDTRFPDGPEAA